jgi:Fe-S-cluster containining protein
MLLSKEDIERLERLGFSREDFTVTGGDGLTRLRNVREWCYFYDLEEKKCQVYEYKPLGCLTNVFKECGCYKKGKLEVLEWVKERSKAKKSLAMLSCLWPTMSSV